RRWQWTWLFHFIPRVIRDAIYDLVARNRYRWFGRRDACILPNSDRSWPSCTAPKLRVDGAARAGRGRHDEGSSLLLFNSVPVTESTICRISFVCAQARL